MRECRAMLSEMPCEITDLAEQGLDTEVEESGQTFEENASLKARYWADRTGLLTLADDSGLEVDALAGAPGVLSARYAGEEATDEERNALLLQRLAGVPAARRTARFRCVIALAEPHGRLELCEGVCEGLIASEPKGSHGFGYDPVFFLPGFGKTMAELAPEEKNRISHRSRAIAKAKELLEHWPTAQGCNSG